MSKLNCWLETISGSRIELRGQTYAHRDIVSAHLGRWDPSAKVWWFSRRPDADRCLAAIAAKCGATNSIDIAFPAPVKPAPGYTPIKNDFVPDHGIAKGWGSSEEIARRKRQIEGMRLTDLAIVDMLRRAFYDRVFDETGIRVTDAEILNLDEPLRHCMIEMALKQQNQRQPA